MSSGKASQTLLKKGGGSQLRDRESDTMPTFLLGRKDEVEKAILPFSQGKTMLRHSWKETLSYGSIKERGVASNLGLKKKEACSPS